MDSQSLLNGLKDLFASLGAKTSDSNYAVGLFDKTTKEPKGVMGMSDLASVLGVKVIRTMINHGNDSTEYSFNADTRAIYIFEDNFANLYRAFFIIESNSIILFANALSNFLSVNGETHKRIHITCTDNMVKIQLTQATSYNLYNLRLY